MDVDRKLAEFVANFRFEDIPDGVLDTVKRILLTTIGTAVAGAKEDGCDTLRAYYTDHGGKPEARVFVFGDKMPASLAATLNGTMCRALDYCDAMAPGQHIGSSLIPAAFAAADLRGGCPGSEFLAALTVGTEVAARLNLSEAEYDGFDPTGVTSIFAATAATARILGLDVEQTQHAMALAFNRSAGSLQSNVDASLAVRLVQGWVAGSGIECARLAGMGLTGPGRFISGVYGYAHLFARDRRRVNDFIDGLGREFQLGRTMFKRYPSCGLTQGVTDLALRAVGHLDLAPSNVAAVQVTVPPYAYRLVGRDFEIGLNPRVNAQFSIQYCVANALVRKASRLTHFRVEEIQDAQVQEMARRIQVIEDAAMDARSHTAVDLSVTLTDARAYQWSLDFAPGFPENPLTMEEHLARYRDCLAYASVPIAKDRALLVPEHISNLEAAKDAGALLDLISV